MTMLPDLQSKLNGKSAALMQILASSSFKDLSSQSQLELQGLFGDLLDLSNKFSLHCSRVEQQFNNINTEIESLLLESKNRDLLMIFKKP